MNTAILKKCVEELQKDGPDLSYVRGMLETLLAFEDKERDKPTAASLNPPAFSVGTVPLVSGRIGSDRLSPPNNTTVLSMADVVPIPSVDISIVKDLAEQSTEQ